METFFEISSVFVFLIPVVTGLVEAVKMIGLPSKFAPLTSILMSIGLSFLIPDIATNVAITQGIIVGLSASGLYSNLKTGFSTKV